MDLAGIQKALTEQQIDGWLLYDFRGSNPIARSVIGFDESQIGTRRWFFLIPRQGEPVGILHVIEPHTLRGVPGREGPVPLLEGARGRPQDPARGDEARGHGVQPGRGHPLRQPRGRGHHRDGARGLRSRGRQLRRSRADVRVTLDAGAEGRCTTAPPATPCWPRTRRSRSSRSACAARSPVTEHEVQQFIQARFDARGLTTHHPCIVAVNDHASDPHFETGPGPGEPRDQEGRPRPHRPLGQGRRTIRAPSTTTRPGWPSAGWTCPPA